MPPEYERELTERYQILEINLELIQNANLNHEQKMMLQRFIETSFKESLQISGEQKQLDHLATITNSVSSHGQQ